MQYSIVIPAFNATPSIAQVIEGIVAAMPTKYSYEILAVNDGSTDATQALLADLQVIYPMLKPIELLKNNGQLAATTCGIHHAQGAACITMDDDGQFPPSELPVLINYFETHNYDLVFGIAKIKAHPKSLLRYRGFARWMFHHIFLRKYRHLEYFSSLRILKTEVVKSGRFANIFMIWHLTPNSIGNAAVQHCPSLKPNTTYTFIKRLQHFKPYLLLAACKTFATICLLLLGLFTAALLLGKSWWIILVLLLALSTAAFIISHIWLGFEKEVKWN